MVLFGTKRKRSGFPCWNRLSTWTLPLPFSSQLGRTWGAQDGPFQVRPRCRCAALQYLLQGYGGEHLFAEMPAQRNISQSFSPCIYRNLINCGTLASPFWSATQRGVRLPPELRGTVLILTCQHFMGSVVLSLQTNISRISGWCINAVQPSGETPGLDHTTCRPNHAVDYDPVSPLC
jgi:hypothetical protein